MSNGDGCDDRCLLESCGNGSIEGLESCDDGNQIETDACTQLCRPARCGDGVKRIDLSEGEDGYEECDDGDDLDPLDTAVMSVNLPSVVMR